MGPVLYMVLAVGWRLIILIFVWSNRASLLQTIPKNFFKTFASNCQVLTLT